MLFARKVNFLWTQCLKLYTLFVSCRLQETLLQTWLQHVPSCLITEMSVPVIVTWYDGDLMSCCHVTWCDNMWSMMWWHTTTDHNYTLSLLSQLSSTLLYSNIAQMIITASMFKSVRMSTTLTGLFKDILTWMRVCNIIMVLIRQQTDNVTSLYYSLVGRCC